MRISSGAPVMWENWSRGFSVSFYNLSVVWPEAIPQTLKPPVSSPAASLSAPGSCKLFQTKGDLDQGFKIHKEPLMDPILASTNLAPSAYLFMIILISPSVRLWL